MSRTLSDQYVDTLLGDLYGMDRHELDQIAERAQIMLSVREFSTLRSNLDFLLQRLVKARGIR